MNGKKIYLSGPITGHDLTERREAFSRTAAMLEREYKRSVWNPTDNGLSECARAEIHMKRDLEALITECDSIYLMKEWEKSVGCRTELDVALACGWKVLGWGDSDKVQEKVKEGEPVMCSNDGKNWMACRYRHDNNVTHNGLQATFLYIVRAKDFSFEEYEANKEKSIV